MVQKIRVFPDYCSTGMWNDDEGPDKHCMVDTTELEIIPQHLLIALRYWHDIWEFNIADPLDEGTCTLSETYLNQWKLDGQLIVDAMNSCQDEITFEFCEDLLE